MDANVWTVVGASAAALTSFGFVPQVLKMWRTRSVADISVLTMWQFMAGNVLWLTYGALRQDFVLVGSSTMALLTIAPGLVLYYRSRLSAVPRFLLAAVHAAEELGLDTRGTLHRAARNLVHGAAEAGTDIADTARATVLAAAEAARTRDLNRSDVIRATATGAVEGALEAAQAAPANAGGNIPASVATRVVGAAADAAPRLDLDPHHAASVAAEGAADAARRLGGEAAPAVSAAARRAAEKAKAGSAASETHVRDQ